MSKISSPVLEPRMPSLSSLRAQEKPALLLSTTKAVMPLEPFSGSVLAYTTTWSASGPYVISLAVHDIFQSSNADICNPHFRTV